MTNIQIFLRDYKQDNAFIIQLFDTQKITLLIFVNCLCFSILFYTFVVIEGIVSDISEALSVLTEEMRMLRASNDAQYAEVCRLNRLVESLNAEIRKRDKKIAELIRATSRKYYGNKRNEDVKSYAKMKKNLSTQ